MIYAPLSFAARSTEYPLNAGAVPVSANGQALVGSFVNGVFGVGPSTGVAGEVFVGFSNAQVSAAPWLETNAVKQETFVASAGGTITTTFTPLAGTVFAFSNTANAPVASPTLTGSVVGGLTAGESVTVTYTYAMSVAQATYLLGNQQPGGFAGAMIGQIGVAQQGRIYTNQFVSSKNWAAATAIKLAANGQLTDQSGTNGVVINAFVVSLPNANTPFLGIEYVVA